MDQKTKIQIAIIIVLTIFLILLVGLTIQEKNKHENIPERRVIEQQEEKANKETFANDIQAGIEIEQNQIDLSQYEANVSITEAGTYTLTGEFKNVVLVNADGEVTLILNGVTIENQNTAAIANISNNPLIIQLADNTVNTLSDGGSSEYDGCVYSNGDLTIEGNGTMYVYGKQEEGEGIATETKDITIHSGKIYIESEDDGINAGGEGGLITIDGGEIFIQAKGDGIDSNKNLIIKGGNIYTIGSPTGGDAGIDTDDGFEINGGTVIALGAGMLEKPETSSSQESISFQLESTVPKGSKISVRNSQGEEVISFEAKEQFRTLIVSNEKITSGTYTLYQDGESTENTVQIF